MTKQTRIKLVQFRVTEEDYALLLDMSGRLTMSDYCRTATLGKNAPVIRNRNALPVKDHEELALFLALLRQTHCASNFNQVTKAINCGMVIVPDYMAESTVQACDHIAQIFKHLMLAFGKKV